MNLFEGRLKPQAPGLRLDDCVTGNSMFTTHLDPESKLDKFVRGVRSMIGNMTPLDTRQCVDADAIEVRVGDRVRTVRHSYWTDDPYSSGQEVGRSLLGEHVQDGDASPARARTPQEMLDKLEAALGSLELTVTRLKAAVEGLRSGR